MDAEKRVKEYIGEQNLIKAGDRVLVGLSGGADSVCLFELLLGLRKELSFSLRAVHVHHGIRESADQDAAYVRALCEKEGVFCYFYREDVPVYAKKQGIGEEEAGRQLRYRDFEESLRMWQAEEETEASTEEAEAVERAFTAAGISGETSSGTGNSCAYKIAVAHHENDQAETVLFQLFRGCGLAGLRGMQPKRGQIIRPLLCLSRVEIEAYLRKKGLSWCEDETNQAVDYSRNKIRHKILACAEKEINSEASAHIAKTAQCVGEAEDYIKRQMRKAYGRCAKEKETPEGEQCVVFDVLSVQKEDPFLQKQLFLYGLERILAARKDIGAVHIEEILKLMEKQGNGELFLPDGAKVKKSYGELLLFRGEREESALLKERNFLLSGEDPPIIETEKIVLAEEEAVKNRFGISEISEILDCIPQKKYTKWFDYDKIEMPFSVRHPESGDFLTIDEAMRRKSFRRYLIENKIPASCREAVWLLADGSHVIWAPGGRMSSYYKVTTKTRTILQVRICSGE